MTKRVISLLLALIVFVSAAAILPSSVFATADGVGYYKITTQNDPLTIRESPSTSSAKRGSVPRSYVIEVTEISGNWGKVTYGGVTGWISLDYATKTTDPPSSSVYATVEPASISARLDELRAKFPNGKYWNHYGSSQKNLDGWTETPCPSGHYLNGVQQCNGQCDGFARKLGLDLFGFSTYNSPWEKVSFNIDTPSVGDIFRYNGKHSVMIVGFTKDRNQLIIADCNWDYHCKIRWDASFSVSRYVSSVNFVMHYSGNKFTRSVYLNEPTTTTKPTTTTTKPDPKVYLDKASCYLPLGASITLTATNVPEISDAQFTWSSSDNSVATVEGGKVKAVSPGSATISAKCGDASASCKVTVTNAVDIKRISGDNRIATAIEISGTGWSASKAENVILANAYSFADALAGVPLSKALDSPILLTANDGSLESDVISQLSTLGAKKICILGGDKVIGTGIEDNLKSSGYTVTRLSGGSRYETAVKIAEKLVALRGSSGTAYLSNAYSFADALSAGPAAAIEGCPILYTAADGTLDKATKEFLSANNFDRARLIGGTSVISDSITDSLQVCGIHTTVRLAGANRYDTCLKAIKASETRFTGTGIALATGTAFPDALAGGALAAKLGIPLILATPEPSADMTAWLHEKDPSVICVFGGASAVSDATVYQYTA